MSYFDNVLLRYRGKGVLIDTNLLLLFAVGRYDPSRIPREARTRKYDGEDFVLVSKVAEYCKRIVTTPHILAEASNLFDKGLWHALATTIDVLKEPQVPSKVVCHLPAFERFGLTDAAISCLAPQRYLVLTDDFRFTKFLETINVDVMNLNHLRTLTWRLW